MNYLRAIYLLIVTLFTLEGYCQVSMTSGSAEFTLPIFSWQDNKSRLNTSIAVVYSSGTGLKVNSVASDLGQGWNLIQGGVITRIQAGEPDDQKPYEGDGTSKDLRKYPAGYYYDTTMAPGYSDHITKYPLYKSKNQLYKQHNQTAADKQMDQFSFQFNGRSGMFIINKKAGMEQVYFLGDTKMKGWFDLDPSLIQQGIRTTITTFYIRDEQGLIYKFSKKELVKILKTVYTNNDGTGDLIISKFKSNKVYYEKSVEAPQSENKNPYIVTAWHLEEIHDPLTDRTIHFTYKNRQIQAESGASLTYYSKNYSIVTHSISYSTTPVIDQITCPDGHSVKFNDAPTERVDLKGAKALSDISITYKNRFLNKYKFNTSYVIKNRMGTPTTDFQKSFARLYLQSIIKMGPDLKAEERPYLFEYYLGTGVDYDFVPAPFYHLKDVWGYYNGNNSRSSSGALIDPDKSVYLLDNKEIKGLCFLRDNSSEITSPPKDGLAKNGLIRSITYPTGSSLIYEYEQNKANLNGQYVSVGGVHVFKTITTDGGYANDCNNPITTSYAYTLANSSESSLWGLENPVNSIAVSTYLKPEKKRFKVFKMACEYTYRYPGIPSRENAVKLTTMQQILFTLSNITSNTTLAFQVLDIVQFAAGIAGPGAAIVDAILIAINVVFTCFSNPSQTNSITIYYNNDLNAANPLPAQFKRVEVMQGDGSSGKTVYEFTGPEDYPIIYPENPVFSSKQRYPYWAYGLPKRTAIYDAAGNIKEETINKYDSSFAWRAIGCPPIIYTRPMASPPVSNPSNDTCNRYFTSYKNLILKNESQRSDVWDNPSTYLNPSYTSDMTSNPDMMVDAYNFYTGRFLLSQTINRKYKQGSGNQYLETRTEYDYNDAGCYNCGEDNYEIREVTVIHPNGDRYFRTIHYNDPTLTDNHIMTTPYAVATSFKKPGSPTLYYTGESVTRFEYAPNGNIVPSKVLTQRFDAPHPTSQMHFYTLPNDTYLGYTVEKTFFYDAYSNPVGQKDEGNRGILQIYDYDDAHITATIMGVDPATDKVAYTSFETDDYSRSGWTVTGSKTYINSGVTGYRSLVLSSGKTLSAQLNHSKSHILSYWSSAPLTLPNGAIQLKNSPVIDGFTYYEYELPQGNTSISLSGNASIDELRLYPRGARMETMTYDILLGKTAECDQNNSITYYEYDELGRIRLIKDEHHDIVKMYEYNLKSQYQSCPAVYSNPGVSEVFERGDCAVGYAGNGVVYTIPAGKYTSTVSQAEVDALVEAELISAGQVYADNHGTCSPIYTNDAVSQIFTKEGCDDGLKGATYTYTVPAGKYTSLISKADADQKALDEAEINGQAYANAPGNSACVVDYDPQFIGEEDAPTQCQKINETYTGHVLILTRDVNPHSPTYNQTQWADMGQNSSCPTSSCTLTISSPFTMVAGSVGYYQDSMVSLYIAFKTDINPYWFSSNRVATINGGCRPASEKTVSISEHGRTWEVKISPDGSLFIRLVSGPAPPLGQPLGLTNIVYEIP